MKEKFFSIIWAALCAWILTYVLLKLDARYNIADMYFFPSVVNFIHGFNIPVRKVFFFLFSGIFLLTGLHKGAGKILLAIIGVFALLVIVALVVMIGWWFISLLANSL
ncbi:MAG: hypothetical protein IJZ30_06350 [Alphaproteobacteria bacterium]|nr:hypothetical protein [Alphaproteobacteria bacterium]